MKAVFLSTNDALGGAAIVTKRLVEALRESGVDARMVVGVKSGNEPWISEVGQFRRKVAKVLERGSIFARNGFNMHDLWKVSTGCTGSDICNHPWVADADTIVLGWINQGVVSLRQIEKLSRSGKRIVWWMHDLWCATGICHIPADCRNFKNSCGNCPLLHGMKHDNDTSHKIWCQKRYIFNSCNIKFIAVSNWQREVALSGSLLSDKDITVIPHAFPVEDYYTEPLNNFHSDALNFLEEKRAKKLIVMGAARLDDPVKDLPMAVSALNNFVCRYANISNDCEAVFFGNLHDTNALSGLELPHHHVGQLSVEELHQLYSAASVVLSTSKFETMGATLMEGMAAGAVPVTFNRGGQGDIVTHEINGYIATYGSPESVADNIARAITSCPFTRTEQHASVKSRFSSKAIANRFISILNDKA